ncbi:hypothetical protein F7725_026099 [Dissostichus mawsoni]|uniref:Uncharacterized protein n=1 Tax=Dissostichus mawsoni TaxID=36200 RepID=A0A7J5X626_DISMA|nr:hypothetical protein F7725_026099 [Dissostichus mawsoni]
MQPSGSGNPPPLLRHQVQVQVLCAMAGRHKKDCVQKQSVVILLEPHGPRCRNRTLTSTQKTEKWRQHHGVCVCVCPSHQHRPSWTKKTY